MNFSGTLSLVLTAGNLLDADGRAHALLGVCHAIPRIALELRPEWCHDREAMTYACSKEPMLLQKAAEFLADDETVVSAAMSAAGGVDEILMYPTLLQCNAVQRQQE